MDELKQKEEETKAQIELYGSLEAVANSKGGKVILASLKKDIISCIDSLCSKYPTASQTELIAIVARMSERLALLRSLVRAEKNKKIYIQELDELISN